MATAVRAEQGDVHIPKGATLIGYEEALENLSSDESFKSVVSAMNALMIGKGFYTAEEFRFQFRQAAQKHLRRRQSPNNAVAASR
jgi:hypothetical protein